MTCPCRSGPSIRNCRRQEKAEEGPNSASPRLADHVPDSSRLMRSTGVWFFPERRGPAAGRGNPDRRTLHRPPLGRWDVMESLPFSGSLLGFANNLTGFDRFVGSQGGWVHPRTWSRIPAEPLRRERKPSLGGVRSSGIRTAGPGRDGTRILAIALHWTDLSLECCLGQAGTFC